MTESFDYLIIGSGAAGSIVATRLAAANTDSICILEAGGDNRQLMVDIPAGVVRNLRNPKVMWQYETEPTVNTGNRGVYVPQGRILGGSTSINGLIYNRGQAGDFDHWAALGNTGWSYQEVLPYFRKSETYRQDTQYRGTDGPVRIGGPEQSHALCDTFIAAVAGLTGVPKHNDYNAASQTGTGYYQRFIHRGKRENIATRYLKPILHRNNISIRQQALVTRILFQQGRATGVEYLQNGVLKQLTAKAEVILCAGTVNSSAILQRSGVGNGEYLQSLAIPVVQHLPGVGENFQDHFFARLAFRLHDGMDSLNLQSKGWRLGREVLRWLFGKPSILAWSPSIAYAFLHAESALAGSNNPEARPNLQFVFSHGSYRPGRMYELDDFPAVTCGFTQQRPYSSGYINITSPDVHAKPVLQPNYLQDERDQQLAIAGVKIARRIMQSAAFAAVYKQEQSPGVELQSDAEILDFVRTTGNTGYHLVGSCKMGPANDPLAVVAPNLCVYGLRGIRVIDASIMPTLTSSNTCAAAMMIGEKGADMLIKSMKD